VQDLLHHVPLTSNTGKIHTVYAVVPGVPDERYVTQETPLYYYEHEDTHYDVVMKNIPAQVEHTREAGENII